MMTNAAKTYRHPSRDSHVSADNYPDDAPTWPNYGGPDAYQRKNCDTLPDIEPRFEREVKR
jgi:hypothetical protein